MSMVFYCVLVLFAVINILKVVLTLLFWVRSSDPRTLTPQEEASLSIIQPILSGDPTLEENLTENLRHLQYAYFIWVINQDDVQAHRVIDAVLKKDGGWRQRVKIIEMGHIPQELNPKVFKLKHAMPFLQKYAVVLDDDTVMTRQNLKRSYDMMQQGDVLVTGIPYYKGTGGVFTNLVTGFVNANSLFTYLPMAYLGAPKTINGMFYMTASHVLRKLDAFKTIETKLCDDYEIAKLFIQHHLPLVQSTMPCKVVTTVSDGRHYLRLMKRWMVFANRFMKENLSWNLFGLVILPSFLPALMLCLAAVLGGQYVLLLLLAHLLKAVLFFIVRRVLLQNKENAVAIVYEVIADYLQVVHYIHASLSSDSIHWRNSKVKLMGNAVRFEP